MIGMGQPDHFLDIGVLKDGIFRFNQKGSEPASPESVNDFGFREMVAHEYPAVDPAQGKQFFQGITAFIFSVQVRVLKGFSGGAFKNGLFDDFKLGFPVGLPGFGDLCETPLVQDHSHGFRVNG